MDRYKVFPSGEMGMSPTGNWTPYADAQATVEALQARLPAEMQECTILFKECEKGHGRLTATNWIDHGCQTCVVEALQRERDALKLVNETHMKTVMKLSHVVEQSGAALDAERDRLRRALEQLARLGNEPYYGNSVGNKIAQKALGIDPAADIANSAALTPAGGGKDE